MQANSPRAFFLSTFLHGAVVALLLLLGYISGTPEKEPKIFELVAGEGDNYTATEAPALGVEGGVKFSAPEPPTPKPAAPEPVVRPAAAEPVITPAPIQKTPPPDAIRDFKKDVLRISTKRQARLEAADRKKREAEEKKAKEAELKNKRLTKEDFDRQNKAAKTPAGSSNPKIARIDAEGIKGGVIGGSKANKTGGAGGKALKRDADADVLDLYFSLLKQRLKEALDKPPGLSDTLVAVVEVRIGSDGTLSGARIAQSSGNAEFDHAALEAFARVRSIGPKPDRTSEVISLKMRMREEDEN